MAEGMSNKVGNVMGVALPLPLRTQFQIRSAKNANIKQKNTNGAINFSRDTDNIKYLANKSAWIRLVSSVDVLGDELQAIKTTIPEGLKIQSSSDLAKHFVLSSGLSIYQSANSNEFTYAQRAGLKTDGFGAYGNIAHKDEILKYGYRPMPGITDAKIQTQGRLGSIRQATINFKVWTKDQLDIMDALYFKMGYLMFLEWGHVYYYDNVGKLQQMGMDMINPFEAGLDKEKLNHKIAKKVEDTNCNYDGMLGMCTKFNFDFNSEGGFDCSISMIGLGALAESTKINQSTVVPQISKDEITSYINLFRKLKEAEVRAQREKDKINSAPPAPPKTAIEQPQKMADYLANTDKISLADQQKKAIPTSIDPNPLGANTTRGAIVNSTGQFKGPYYRNLGIYIPDTETQRKLLYSSYTIDQKLFNKYSQGQVSTNGSLLQARTIYSSQNRSVSFGNENTTVGQIISLSIDYPSTKTKYGCSMYTDYEAVIGGPNEDKLYGVSVATIDGRVGVFKHDLTGYVEIEPNRGGSDYVNFYPIYASDQLGSQLSAPPKLERNAIPTADHKKWFEFLMVEAMKGASIASSESLISKINRRQEITSHFTTDARGNLLDVKVKPLANEAGETYSLNGTIIVKPNIFVKGVSTNANTIGGTTVQDETQIPVKISHPCEFQIYADAAIITDAIPVSGANLFLDFSNKQAAAKAAAEQLAAQQAQQALKDQINKEVDDALKEEAVKYNSGLEVFLRAIQLHSLNRVVGDSGLDFRKVTQVDLIPGDFVNQLFSTGLFQGSVNDLANDPKKFDKGLEVGATKRERLLSYATYGFNHNLMGAADPKRWIADNGLKQNDFKSMFKAWVMPYDIHQPVLANVDINHPVYIKLDLLIMAINHMCMLYDSPKSPDGKQVVAENQTPIIYMDFNTETNTCLSMPLHMSIDILKFMIPFRGTNEEYKLLFEDEVTLSDGKTEYIKRGGDEIESLFKPETEDHISGFLPDFKDPNNSSTGAWQGRIMNILVNIDYLLNLCNSFSTNDDSHSVFLKPFMQQLVTDMAKSMGDVNLFRLAYSDKSNCLYITDDQSSPLNAKEQYASNLPPMLDSGLDGINVNSIELPLYGLTSIAKSVSIKTEVSTKLSNMLAISANSDKKSSASKDATPFGVYNLNFSDRYKPQAATVNQDVKKVTDGEVKAAGMFNSYVNSIFRTDQPQIDGTPQALNYYIDRMNNKKSERAATRASAMIPVSVDFTTDGISGFSMGHAFLLPEQMLPNTYARFNQSQEKRVGFVVVGLDHSIQGNNWDTSVKANMFFMKTANDFYSDKKYFNFNPLAQAEVDGVSPYSNSGGGNSYSEGSGTSFTATNAEARKACEDYIGRALSDIEFNELVSATFAESGGSVQENGHITAAMLNRARNRNKTVSVILREKNQFQSVTGTKSDGHRPSPNFVNGPPTKNRDKIYQGMVSVLPTVAKSIVNFTAANLKAYGPGTNPKYIDELKSKGGFIVGQSWFSA